MKLHQVRFLPLLILAMLVNILAQATHETGHHMIYQVMGHEPVWAFTKVVQLSEPPTNSAEWVEITNPDDSSNWLKVSSLPLGKTEKALAAAAGPLAVLLGAMLGVLIARRSRKITWKQIGLAFALVSSLVMVLYYLRSPMRTGGDEYDLATQLGIAKSFIEIPLALAFLACLSFALRELPTWRIRLKWLGTILLGSIITGLPMAMADPFLIAQVDAGNPWFQPILGYSLPVFAVIVLTCFGIWAWARWQDNSKNIKYLGE
jgi:hypothetical protein